MASAPQSVAAGNRKVALIMAGVALAMLGLGYASVPLYRLFCQATGWGGTTQRVTEAQAKTVKAVAGKTVVVRFDGNVARGMPWEFGPDQVTAPIGALPAQRLQGRVLLGVLGRVEVAGQPDTADDQLARLALGDALPLRVDDGEVPAVERQPDAHRWLAGEPGAARDDGGLGGAVGVPDLASGGG